MLLLWRVLQANAKLDIVIVSFADRDTADNNRSSSYAKLDIVRAWHVAKLA